MSVNDYRTPPTTELFTVQHGQGPNSCTFVFGNEDHTLGNSLRHIVSLHPNTDFVGYSCPHPYEPKMNFRLQTREKAALSVLKDGLKDLEETANVLDDAFIKSLREFKQKQGR